MSPRRSAAMLPTVLAAILLAFGACTKSEQKPASQAPAAAAGTGVGGDLTAFELENGVGPIKEAIKVGSVDEELAEKGGKVFAAKCAACHKIGERYVGPALAGVTERRTPTYVMNMILNPDGMYTRHPVARQLLGEYMTQMPNLGVPQDEARAIMEYLRTKHSSEKE
jgi:cytochrome c